MREFCITLYYITGASKHFRLLEYSISGTDYTVFMFYQIYYNVLDLCEIVLKQVIEKCIITLLNNIDEKLSFQILETYN